MFAARMHAGRDLAVPELLALCTTELDLKSAVLDGLADGIVVHTYEGDILYHNPAAAIIYGFGSEEFGKLGRYEWIPPEIRPNVAPRLETLVDTGVLDFQSRGLTADGGTIATEVHARFIDLPDLGRVIVSVIQDVTEQVAVQEMIRHLAYHDTLTGLANRVMLDEQLHMAMAAADRHGDVVGVVFLDLDAFKPVNDTFGHAAGDFVLKTVAERLKQCVREYDTVARVGGDEFVVLFPRLRSREELASLGNKISDCIGETIDLDGRAVTITASVGLATHSHGEAPDELISRADHAMYRARIKGVDGWQQSSLAD
jgi:diguanylate cyclase (GGDEF)-like protein/PAS domain S-box-containing protein